MPFDQVTPYWDPNNKQLSIGGSIAGSVETMQTTQATGASATIPLGIAARPGKIVDARIAAITPLTTNDTYTVDIKKNGTTILSAPMALLAATGARASVVGVLTVTTVAVNDFFEAVIVYTHGTGTAPLNVVAQLGLILN